MPITINGVAVSVGGSMTAVLGGFSADLDGTFVAPPSRSGVISSNPSAFTASLNGQFAVPASRDGDIDSVLSAFSADFDGTSAAPGGIDDPIIVEGTTNYIVDFDSGTDGGAGNTWATRWKTAAYARTQLQSLGNATAVYFVSEGSADSWFTVPTSHGGSPGNEFIVGACYRDGANTRRALELSYTLMPRFDQGLMGPEWKYITGSDNPASTRRWTRGEFDQAITCLNVSNVRIENILFANLEHEGIRCRTTDQATSQLNRDNAYSNVTIFNCHFEHIYQNSILIQFYNDVTIEHCYGADLGRRHFFDDLNLALVAAQGCTGLTIKDNDGEFCFGEMYTTFGDCDDVQYVNNLGFGANAVHIYLDPSRSCALTRNLVIGCAGSQANHLASTAPGAIGLPSRFNGQAIEFGFEQWEFNKSWVNGNHAPQDVLIAFNVGLGCSDGYLISTQGLTSTTVDWDSIDVFCNFFAGNTDGVARGSIAGIASYTNNELRANIVLNAGEAATNTDGTDQGLTSSHNYWDGTVSGGFSSGTDVTSGLAISKTSGFRNITLTTPAAQRGWGDLRSEFAGLITSITPQAGSTTIGAGPALSTLQLPAGFTRATLAELSVDYNGNALADPLDIGPFSSISGTPAPSYVGVLQSETPAASATWTATLPAAAQAGDLALALITGVAGTEVVVDLTGWTQIGSTQVPEQPGPDPDSTTLLCWRALTASDITTGSWTFNNLWAGTRVGNITIVCYRGQDAAPIDQVNSTWTYITSGNQVAGPSITTTGDNRRVIQLIACDIGTGPYTATPDPLATERADLSPPTNRQWAYVQDYVKSTAGAATLSATVAQTDAYAHFIVAIK